MAKITGKDFERVRGLIVDYMGRGDNWRDKKPKEPGQVENTAMAWELAHRSGAVSYCFGDTSRDIPGIKDCHDSHIRTALKSIFVNAGF